MKKQVKKLVLAKETVRRLNLELLAARGGDETYMSCNNVCPSASCGWTCQCPTSDVIIEPQTRNC